MSCIQRMKMLLFYFGGSFLLHLLWENAQAPLFANYVSFAQHFPICLRATITGDLFMVFLLYLVLALVHRDLQWLERKDVFRHPATWVLPPFIGALFAIIIELRALLEHRWSYTDAMPILPFFPVGIVPVLQMIVVPLVTLLLCRWLLKRQEISSPSQSSQSIPPPQSGTA